MNKTRIISIVFFAFLISFPAVLAGAGAGKVLVLYNRDWTGDLPGTEAGQDSEEVARYYVRCHTDPKTGEKPYVLGLSGKLNGESITEASSDNYFGVIYRGKGRGLSKKQKYYMLSSRIECRLPKSDKLDPGSVTLKIRRVGDDSPATIIYNAAKPTKKHAGVIVRDEQEGKGKKGKPVRRIFFDAARAGFRGELLVTLTAKNTSGKGRKILTETVRYFDPADFAFSRTGPDNRRDDQHYMDLIEKPVKKFLEDPENAVNGQLLKDRILYIVICYGLPRTVRRTYGIAQTAVPTSPRDSGNMVSLCQRLETLYYDIEAVRPPRLTAIRLRKPLGHFMVRMPVSTMWFQFIGPRYQPLVHGAAYKNFRKHKQFKPPWKSPPHLTCELRNRYSKRFLYVCSRIDAHNPRDAKHMIDAAQYAQRYLTPHIGSAAGGKTWDGAKALAKTEDKCGAAELKALGLPGCGKSRNYGAYFGRVKSGGYLPGAIDWDVISKNGLNRKKSAINLMLKKRVTVTAGAARTYRGCAHTTTHGWWDSRVFYHYLFRGYDLGEAWAMSKFYCQWVTSFFGDPLYRPDLRKTQIDKTPPSVSKPGDIRVTISPKNIATIRVKLCTTPDNPELAQASVEYWEKGDVKNPKTATDPHYRKRPIVTIQGLKSNTIYYYRIILTDPYQNTFDSAEKFGVRTFRTTK